MVISIMIMVISIYHNSNTSSLAISGTDRLEVPTICKAYVRGYTPRIWPENWY